MATRRSRRGGNGDLKLRSAQRLRAIRHRAVLEIERRSRERATRCLVGERGMNLVRRPLERTSGFDIRQGSSARGCQGDHCGPSCPVAVSVFAWGTNNDVHALRDLTLRSCDGAAAFAHFRCMAFLPVRRRIRKEESMTPDDTANRGFGEANIVFCAETLANHLLAQQRLHRAVRANEGDDVLRGLWLGHAFRGFRSVSQGIRIKRIESGEQHIERRAGHAEVPRSQADVSAMIQDEEYPFQTQALLAAKFKCICFPQQVLDISALIWV